MANTHYLWCYYRSSRIYIYAASEDHVGIKRAISGVCLALGSKVATLAAGTIELGMTKRIEAGETLFPSIVNALAADDWELVTATAIGESASYPTLYFRKTFS